jgi:Domain of unknown function (DUF1707)
VAFGPGQAYPPFPAVPAGTGVHPAWLAGSADRERTVGVLRAAFTEGRLTQDELDDRVAQAYAARTYSDLWALTADLPAGPLPYPNAPYPNAPNSNALPGLPYPPPGSPAVPPGAEPTTSWHSAAALVITALVIFTLAALVTAIATAHAQPFPFQQMQPIEQLQPLPFQQVQPFQHAKLAPFITSSGHAQGQAPGPFGP